MYNGDAVSDMINYSTSEYPDIDIRKSKKKFRKREYEKIILDDIYKDCFDRMFEDPVDILEDYELVYEYFNIVYNNDIYKFQLNVIRKLLIFMKRRKEKYG